MDTASAMPAIASMGETRNDASMDYKQKGYDFPSGNQHVGICRR
jgi:hypothetical protein